MSFNSEVVSLGSVKFPTYSGVRIMMMPFLLEDMNSIHLTQYQELVSSLRSFSPAKSGVAYLTIDEAEVLAGETHRRGGLHVDGIGPDGKEGGWGGGGGGWGSAGMILASSVVGCKG